MINRLLIIVACTCLWACAATTDSQPPIVHSSYVPEGYRLVWNDEFESDGKALPDTTQWYYETGGGGWGNNELQYYLPAATVMIPLPSLKMAVWLSRPYYSNSPLTDTNMLLPE